MVVSPVYNKNLQIPYSSTELRMLEISLMNWIKSMGVLAKLGKENKAESLIEL